MNYRVAAAMQQIGYGNTDAATLAGFLDLPGSWSLIARHMKRVEEVMGPVQVQKREESEMDAASGEVEAQKEHDDHRTHECTIEGHEHPPLPMVKGTYGK